jgi:hypothetical protein
MSTTGVFVPVSQIAVAVNRVYRAFFLVAFVAVALGFEPVFFADVEFENRRHIIDLIIFDVVFIRFLLKFFDFDR